MSNRSIYFKGGTKRMGLGFLIKEAKKERQDRKGALPLAEERVNDEVL
jgi:hypothetical protein